MQGKSSKGKRSLQKTSCSVINMHTHRHSHISDTLPYYFNNDSIASLRANSLHKTSKVGQSILSGHKKMAKQDIKRTKSKEEREKTKNKKDSKRHIKNHVFYQLYSQGGPPLQTKNRRQGCLQAISRQLKQKASSSSSDLACSLGAKVTSKETQLNELLRKTRTVLNSYKLYNEQLELDCKRYKARYGETLRKLKKYQLK